MSVEEEEEEEEEHLCGVIGRERSFSSASVAILLCFRLCVCAGQRKGREGLWDREVAEGYHV